MRHQRVEDVAAGQDDQVVHDRHRSRAAEVDLADGDLHQVNRQEGGGAAGTAARHHGGLGVDHEGLHETQQHGDHQHLLQLRQLDVAEHRPAPGAVDPRRLVVGIGDRAQPCIAQQDDQRRPVPNVDHHDRQPCRGRILGDVVVQAERVQPCAEQADISAGEDLPDRADHVPRDQHRQGRDHQRHPHRPATPRQAERDANAERQFDQQCR